MEDPPSFHSIQVVNESDLRVEPRLIEEAVALCLQMAHADPSNVRILVAPDDVVADLNLRYRNSPEATDVLTFSDEDAASGDIAIAGPYSLRQANERGIAFQDEITLLALHGALHLLGLDDETEPERLEMVRRMYEVAGRLGMQTSDDWGSLLHQEAAV